MKKIIFVFLIAFASLLSASAQTSTVKIKKPHKTWVYTKENSEKEVLLTGATDSTLLVYTGSKSAYRKDTSPQLTSINYKNIDIIRIRTSWAFSKGLLIGAGIGLLPVVFGQGGAYVAIITFPLGIITGSVIGATSKKKYEIKGDFHAFTKFTHKYVK